MEGISSSLPSVDLLASNANLSRIVEGSKFDQPAGIDEKATEFESLFLGLLMKEMRNTLSEGAMFGGESSDIYGGLFDMMMGDSLAESEPLGIAKMLQSAMASYAQAEQPVSETPVDPDSVDVSL